MDYFSVLFMSVLLVCYGLKFYHLNVIIVGIYCCCFIVWLSWHGVVSVLNKRITYLLTYLQQRFYRITIKMHKSSPVAAALVFYSISLAQVSDNWLWRFWTHYGQLRITSKPVWVPTGWQVTPSPAQRSKREPGATQVRLSVQSSMYWCMTLPVLPKSVGPHHSTSVL